MKRQTEVSFLDGKNIDYSQSETENDNRRNDLEMVNECDPGKLPSSLYKGIVSQSNGGWGAQLCEKRRQIWLGAFHDEKDAASAKENADVRFSGQNVMTNFMPAEKGYTQILLSDDSNGETSEKLPKHHDEELDHSKNMSPTVTSQPSFLMGRLAMRVKAGKDIEEKGDRTAEKMEKSDREHMFDKAVTPSDVGKLNRLVIPKQHAEKYFPLEKSGNDKGLVLSFEDSSGKEWRFRYSYWRSSQSYVLTKGWSRFVRDNKLQAGDIVSFDRAIKRLYISWRRRPCAALHPCKAALLPPRFSIYLFPISRP